MVGAIAVPGFADPAAGEAFAEGVVVPGADVLGGDDCCPNKLRGRAISPLPAQSPIRSNSRRLNFKTLPPAPDSFWDCVYRRRSGRRKAMESRIQAECEWKVTSVSGSPALAIPVRLHVDYARIQKAGQEIIFLTGSVLRIELSCSISRRRLRAPMGK
jgi:hypothetical protein